MKHVVIAGGADETRLLLRGLVRLHHHRVVAEGGTPETLREADGADGDTVVILDADLDDPTWAEAVRSFTDRHRDTVVILLTASRSPQVEARARAVGVARLLHRPFAVHELVSILEPTS